MRNDVQTRHHRLLRLEETVWKHGIKLGEERIQALERFAPEYRERHIEVNRQAPVERLHRAVPPRLLEVHLRIKGRTTWYEALEEMRKDLQ